MATPPPSGCFILVEPKPEPGLPTEYEEIARRGFSDEDALRWARDDYLRDEMVRQRRALEEGCRRIGGRGRGDDDDGGGGDYTRFYSLLGM